MTDKACIRLPSAKGLTVIEASAGTGKTWTIAHLVPLFLATGEIKRLDELVLATFTEAAAGELAGRVRETLAKLVQLLQSNAPAPDDEPGIAEIIALLEGLDDQAQAGQASERQQAVLRLERALDDSDRLLSGTLHSFCRRILVDEAFLCGIPAGFTVLKDIKGLRSAAVRDLWRTRIAKDPLLASMATLWGWSVEQDIKLAALAAKREGATLSPALDLAAQRSLLAQGLAGLQSHAKQLLSYRKRFIEFKGKGVEPSKRPQAPSEAALEAWAELIQRFDPERPSAQVLEVARDLVKLPQWLTKTRTKGAVKKELEEAIEGFSSLELLADAEAINQAEGALHWAWKCAVAQESRAKVEAALATANALDFDRLVLRLRDALCQGLGQQALRLRLRRRWKIALVDESQDTDSAQLQVFRSIFEDAEDGHRLILIGDPKQSIYSFRGADPRAYALAKQGALETVALDKTFRSAQGLVQALNQLFGRARPALGPGLDVPAVEAAKEDAKLPLPDQGDPYQGARLVAVVVPESARDGWGSAEDCRPQAAEAAATAVAAHLSARTQGKAIDPGDCAVLTSSNSEAQAVLKALADRDIRAVIQKNGDVLSSEAAAEWRILLSAILDPGRQGARRAALATRLLGLGAQELASMDASQDEAWRQRFMSCLQEWRRNGLQGLRAALDAGDWGRPMQRLAGQPDGERLVTDSRHLLELADAAAQEQALSPEGLLEWLAEASAEDADEVAAEERERRLEKDGAAVQIMTMHGAKGLEYDYVFCPYLWNNGKKEEGELLYPDEGGSWTLAATKLLNPEQVEAVKALMSQERLKERLRLAYVALTRAKRRAWFLAGWIGYPTSRAQAPTALDWLLRGQPKAEDLELDGLSNWHRSMAELKQRSTQKDLEEPALGKACQHPQALQSLEALAPGLLKAFPLMINNLKPARVAALGPFPAAKQRPNLSLGAWQTTSFTSLSSQDHAMHPFALSQAAADGLEAGEVPRVPLAGFPRGAKPGSCLHQILEHWDFGALDAQQVQEALDDFGIHSEANQALLMSKLPKVAQALVPCFNEPLSRVAQLPRLSELDFLLPLQPGKAFNGPVLAELFEQHGDAPLKAYGPKLRELTRSVLGGMLTGSIDRLGRQGQRWAILDWKSNYLGERPLDYAPEKLWADASASHYLLQLLLYMVAARRYLALKGQGDQLDSACVAYLRGLQPGKPDGMLCLTPPAGLLSAMDALFAPGGGR